MTESVNFANIQALELSQSTCRPIKFSSFRGAKPNCKPLVELLVAPYPWWKRTIDVLGSVFGLIILFPLLLATAIAIKLTSKGPVIFVQERAGIGGKPFKFYKFRTMVENAEKMKKDLLQYNERSCIAFKMSNDPRITKVGRILRKTSIDEFPQFINVLLGDMALVGPRPPTFDEVKQYEGWHKGRLDIKPGITCIWQITSRNDSNFNKWVRLDIKYKQTVSMANDLKIILNTVPAVVACWGAK